MRRILVAMIIVLFTCTAAWASTPRIDAIEDQVMRFMDDCDGYSAAVLPALYQGFTDNGISTDSFQEMFFSSGNCRASMAWMFVVSKAAVESGAINEQQCITMMKTNGVFDTCGTVYEAISGLDEVMTESSSWLPSWYKPVRLFKFNGIQY